MKPINKNAIILQLTTHFRFKIGELFVVYLGKNRFIKGNGGEIVKLQ